MTDDAFMLVDHQRSIARLEELIRRVGASMSCEEFVHAVSMSYYEVEAPRHATEMHAYFHSSGAYGHFKQALVTARQMLPRPLAILDIGCGAGYELGILREVFARDEVERIVCLDISADMMARAWATMDSYPCCMMLGTFRDAQDHGPFHLVVTHAMVHHVANLASFFAGIERLLLPGGCYVMGHEPNRRHWTHLEKIPLIRRLHAAEKRRRQMRKLLQPSRYLNKLARLLRLAQDQSPEAKVNRILRERYGFSAELTPKEIHRLVDVHVPDRLPGDFRIGFDGFDWDELAATMLPGFQRVSLATYGYTRESPSPKYWPRNWERLEAELAKEYPLDGICFTALWRKPER